MFLASTPPSLVVCELLSGLLSGMHACDEKVCHAIEISYHRCCTSRALSQYECARVPPNTGGD